MTIARINTKHASEKQSRIILNRLKGMKCKTLLDIKGPKSLKWIQKLDFDYLAVLLSRKNQWSLTPLRLQGIGIRPMFKQGSDGRRGLLIASAALSHPRSEALE